MSFMIYLGRGLGHIYINMSCLTTIIHLAIECLKL